MDNSFTYRLVNLKKLKKALDILLKGTIIDKPIGVTFLYIY